MKEIARRALVVRLLASVPAFAQELTVDKDHAVQAEGELLWAEWAEQVGEASETPSTVGRSDVASLTT
jgi:hypothetical protein